jgi:hypothetical protein
LGDLDQPSLAKHLDVMRDRGLREAKGGEVADA